MKVILGFALVLGGMSTMSIPTQAGSSTFDREEEKCSWCDRTPANQCYSCSKSYCYDHFYDVSAHPGIEKCDVCGSNRHQAGEIYRCWTHGARLCPRHYEDHNKSALHQP